MDVPHNESVTAIGGGAAALDSHAFGRRPATPRGSSTVQTTTVARHLASRATIRIAGFGPVSRRWHTGWMGLRHRSYTTYSIGCAVVWAAILAVAAAGATHVTLHTLLLVFGGWAIAWVSGTIARYVYRPPQRWRPSP
jgi:hypothetical protein